MQVGLPVERLCFAAQSLAVIDGRQWWSARPPFPKNFVQGMPHYQRFGKSWGAT
ncbi:hypothetical protein STRAU_7544 [Streptomyces aurantiacus JA 4570]|uniref:Uncharacterized protein n=1 Tax=Streptomyces aurantiacus JA 4570 TaxID=1286094 RepID=S3Z9X1_9ACTN|nr:hypothetical protein STRAU_7544 [Streptomyces aurantiacus JA 4570]